MDIQTILSNIVLAGLIGGVAMAIGRSGRRASLAHVMWIVFFIKLVTPPLWPIQVTIDQQNFLGWKLDWLEKIGDVFFLVWLTGFLALVIRGIVMYARFSRLLKREGRLDPEATVFVQSLLEGRRKTPPVIRLPVRLSPMLFGDPLHPKIVCPDQLWGLLTDDQRRAFLAHETAHYIRRDHWVRWLEWMVTAVYWWFPGVYFGRDQLQRHEEACCDAWAVSHLNTTPRAYAETLLSVVDFISDHESRLPRLASGMHPTYSLEERLRLLMRPQPGAQPSNGLKVSALTLGAGLWMMHPILAFHPRDEQASVEQTLDKTFTSSESVTIDSNRVMTIPYQWPSDHFLPKTPQGFWNDPLETR
jgi:bla regulator protein blaR1